MELIYLWIEKYKNIEKQGFNFSSNWWADYENEKLTIKKRDSIKEIFGENIINITALIGSNGVGKTTLLDFLYEKSCRNENLEYALHNSCSNVFTFKHKYQDFSNLSDDDFIGCKFFYVVKWEKDKELEQLENEGVDVNEWSFKIKDNNFEHLQNDVERSNNIVPSILYSPFVRDKWYENRAFNYTTSYGLSGSHYPSHQTDFQRFLHYETRTIIKLLISGLTEKFPFKLTSVSTKLHFFVPNNFWRKQKFEHLENLLAGRGFNKDLDFYRFISSVEYTKLRIKNNVQDIFVLEFLKSLIASAFESFVHRVPNNSDNSKVLVKGEGEDIYLRLQNFLTDENLKSDIKEHISILRAYLILLLSDEILGIIDWFEKEIFTPELIEIANEILVTSSLVDRAMDKEEDFFNLLKIILFERFDCTKENLSMMPIFPFMRISMNDMSSGERHFLQLFGRLFMNCQYANTYSSILLLIDEGEIGLHPEWQKQYINLLIKVLPEIYKKPIQLIITSHSPFLVSDLPKENIIFLEKNAENKTVVVDGIKQKETFGANIHTLFTDSFFMKDGLMGDFAKSKINEVIKYLNKDSILIKDDNEAQMYIDIIGEPILKRQLQKMLDSKRLEKIDKIDEIESLKETINKLSERVVELEKKKK